MSMIQNHFSINVAKATGRMKFGTNKPAFAHFFDTDVVYIEQAREVFVSLKAAYPYPSFDVTVKRVDCSGLRLDWS